MRIASAFAAACLAVAPMAAQAREVACPGGVTFDWERVHRFVLVAANQRDFTDAEVAFLAANFDLITVGNAHAQGAFEGNEAASRALAARLKAANPTVRVLLYWNSFIEYEFSAATREPKPEDWYVHDLQGERYTPGAQPRNRWNHADPDFRRWWVDQVARTLNGSQLDGVFVDAVPQVAGNPGPMAARIGAEATTALADGLQASLADLRARLGSDAVILYNGLRHIPDGWSDGGRRYLADASGAYIEHFDFNESATTERLTADIELMRQVSATGDYLTVLKGWPGFSWLDADVMTLPPEALETRSRDALTFPLAAFLVGMGPCSYFAYGWGYREPYGVFVDYPELERPLGRPLGEALRDGTAYTRRFEHADVRVDLSTREASIDWRQSSATTR